MDAEYVAPADLPAPHLAQAREYCTLPAIVRYHEPVDSSWLEIRKPSSIVTFNVTVRHLRTHARTHHNADGQPGTRAGTHAHEPAWHCL
jgi:hypothetical protein